MLAKILAPFAAALLCAAALVLPQATEKTLLFTGAQSYRFYAHSQSSQAEIVQASPENAFDLRILRRASSAASRPFPALILP